MQINIQWDRTAVARWEGLGLLEKATEGHKETSVGARYDYYLDTGNDFMDV